MDETGQESLSTNTIIKLVIAWLWVGLPLAWGLYQTYEKALPLFR